MECNGAGAAPPATLAEFTLGRDGADDFYDVSLVDGYNVAMIVEGSTGSGASCTTTGCIADLNARCPAELRVGDGEACKSACEAFGTAEYCCSGEFGSPSTCKPTAYSAMFKAACPKSYSYAYDDASSTFTCSSAAQYTITFCPNFSSMKSKTDSLPKAVDGAASTILGGKGSWLANLALGDSTRPQPSCAQHVSTLLVLAALTISFVI
uniref:Thaumatin-like protein n=1 Tax=Kalanchoe fedtschenkoi TaxID=63787 RepID=A0A7N0TE84_KALFE